MTNAEILSKITQKKEFSQLPKKDVEIAFEKFEKKNLNDYQLLKLTRNFLRKIYSSFSSRKLLGETGKDKDVEWVLNKHKSTKERMPFYDEIYGKIFEGLNSATIPRPPAQEKEKNKSEIEKKESEFSVIDLGCGINGLSYSYMKKFGKINYLGVEAVGQLVELTNDFFRREKLNGKAIHESLFELEKIKKLISEMKNPRIVFLFKVIDSLEVMERDYSKKLLLELAGISDRIVVSFATRSLGRRSRFSSQRGWLLKFLDDNFKVLKDWEVGGERYLVVEGK